jgi:hypothetical protein
VLVVALSHFPEVKSELELHGSWRNANIMEDQADALWTRVREASDSLALHVPPSVTYNPPVTPQNSKFWNVTKIH